MRRPEKEFIIKDGRKATLRSPEISDTEKYIEFLIRRAEETDNMLRDPDECDRPEEISDQIRQANGSAAEVLLLCEVKGKIVGSCDMSRKLLRKTRHRAELSIGILKDYWGLGIASAMLRELIRIAQEQGITQLELNVFEGNERAMRLYEKFGFEVVAIRPNCIHLRDGSRLKAYTMFLPLE